jgi:hypothetical protein
MRAPPEALKMMHGTRRSMASSIARVIFRRPPPHRAAAELEVHHRHRDLDPMDPAGSAHDRLGQAAFLLIALEAFGIRLGVNEPERITRPHSGIDFRKGARIEQFRDPRPRPSGKW